jgi:uncharacterized protein (DUF983 family)
MTTSRASIMWRGLTKRCARCGSGHLFRHYFTMVPECPRCGLHFERESGYWAGALAINFVCTGGLVVLLLVALFVATLPDVNAALILAVLLPVAVIGPALWYPHSKTLWVAVDRAYLQRLDRTATPDE